jgi:uncharacterized protein RhaS with RHS repeats
LRCQYNYFRDYDPRIGRYIESDPIGLLGGINTFGYVLGSPLKYQDPKGLSASDIVSCLLNPSACWDTSPMRCRSEALNTTKQIFGRNGEGDSSDAFRHCVWSCCMAKNGGATAAKAVGDGHEWGPGNPRCHKNMDLFNNAMGISLASTGGDCTSGCLRMPLQKRPNGSCQPCGTYF